MLNNQKVRLKKCQLHGGEQGSHPFATDIVFRKHNDFVVISTGGKNSIIAELVIDEKAENIVNELKLDDCFHTSSKELYKSSSQRAFYGPDGFIK